MGDLHYPVFPLLLIRNSVTHGIRFLVGPQARSGCFGEEKNFLHPPGFELRTPSDCTDSAIVAPVLLMQHLV
jgi:hypothetical protein